MDQFENNWWSALANTNKLRLFVLGQCQLCPRRQPGPSSTASATAGGPGGSQGL